MSLKSQNLCMTDAGPCPYVLTNQEVQRIRIYHPQPSSTMHLYRRYERVWAPPQSKHVDVYTQCTCAMKTSPTTQANKVTFITSNFRIHEYIISPRKKRSTNKNAGEKKIKICLQPNRIDLKSNNSVSDPCRSWIRVRWSPFIQVCQGLFRLVYC